MRPPLARVRGLTVGVMDAVRVELDRVVPSRLRARRWAFDGTDRQEIAFASTAHAGVELAWIEEGAIRYRLGADVVELRAGQAMLVPTGVDHASAFMGHMRGASVHLDDGMVARVADAAGAPMPCSAGLVLEGAAVSTLGALLVGELARDTVDARLCADALAEALALKALGSHRVARTDERDARVLRAIDVIRARFTENIDVDEIASAAGSSRFHLSRLFKSATGKSPYQYLVDVRLEHAASLLRSKHSVTHAALSSGFSDLSRFARMFRERYGATPRAYSSSAAA
jgi:AraC family transcriptional regulator